MTNTEESDTVGVVLEKASDGISVRQAAERFGVTAPTVRSWVEKGILPATRFGTIIRIDPQDLDKLRRPAYGSEQ